jgi:hypothetical protein
MSRTVNTRNADKKTAYTQTNAIKVLNSVPAGTGETASAVRIIPLITHG